MQELKEYREAIEFLAKKQEDFVYDNKGANHAVIVLVNMLKNTKNEFAMFSGNFDSQVADKEEFIEELKNYIESGKVFKLVLEKDISEKSNSLKIIKKLAEEYKNIKIIKAKDSFIRKLKEIFDGEVFHFAVSDERSYRLEIGQDTFKAVCNFNDPEIAKELNILLNENFSN